jgi:hypothetical protein
MMKLIAPRSRTMSKRHRLDAGTLQKALYPRANWKIQIDAPRIDEQRHLPNRDDAESNGSTFSPATIDHGLRCQAQPVIAAIEPEGDMCVEQQCLRHWSISRPVWVSGAISEDGCRQIDSLANLNGPGVRPEQRSRSGILIQEAPHGQCNRFGLAAASQLLGSLFDQRNDVRPIDRDYIWHIKIVVIGSLNK